MRSDPKMLDGRYRLEEVIGAGGMGTVMRAQDEVLERPVAVKILKEELASDGATVERFRREALIAASLSHPGIASVFDFGGDGGIPFIVMELLDGEDLHRVLSRHSRLPPAEAAAIVSAAASALDHAHRAGAVHRDIKPGNIFLTRGGAVKVTDFGIAHAASMAPVTTAGTLVGTPSYLSPEQVRGDRATPSSDIYSLGCVLYQLLTGRPPFEAETSIGTASAHLSQPVPSARDTDPGIPPELDAVVSRALAKEPGDRFASAGEMAASLKKASRSSGPVTGLIAGPETTVFALEEDTATLPPAEPRRRRGRGWFVAALVAAALALLALGFMPRPVAVGNVTGLTYDGAAAALKHLGLKARRVDRSSAEAAGKVLDQSPHAGARVSRGTTVELSVSRGNLTQVPDVSLMSVADASDALRQSGFKVSLDPADAPDDATVSGQTPAGGTLAVRTSTVTISATPAEVPVRGKGRGKRDQEG